MAKKEESKTVTVNGVNYNLDDLSEEAKNQLLNLRVVDQEIARLNQLLAISQTARNSYAQALANALPKAAKTTTAVQ